MLVYLQSCVGAMPSVSHASAWILRHEHHFLYLVLRLAHRLVLQLLHRHTFVLLILSQMSSQGQNQSTPASHLALIMQIHI